MATGIETDRFLVTAADTALPPPLSVGEMVGPRPNATALKDVDYCQCGG